MNSPNIAIMKTQSYTDSILNRRISYSFSELDDIIFVHLNDDALPNENELIFYKENIGLRPAGSLQNVHFDINALIKSLWRTDEKVILMDHACMLYGLCS